MIFADCDYRAIGRNPNLHWLEEHCRAWLGEAERTTLATLRDRSRREEWLLARRLAKETVLDRLKSSQRPASLRDIHIHSRNRQDRSACPEIRVRGAALEWSLSICHGPTTVAVALCATPGVTIGVDLVPLVPTRRGFVDMWLTERERAWVDQQQNRYALATIWSVKEAAYKALASDEPFAPRALEVRCDEDRRFYCLLRGRQLPFRQEIHTRRSGEELLALARFDRRSVAATSRAADHSPRAPMEVLKSG